MPRWSWAGFLLLAVGVRAQDPAVVFDDVHVVPMDREVVLERQTVVVRDGRIARIGPRRSVQVPDGAVRVDAAGKYLIPGLCDMHVHLSDRAELLLYVAHGVTRVRNMWGGPDTLELRARTARGEVLGPRVWTTGPIVDGPRPRWNGSTVLASPDAARELVDRHRAAGYDAIKVYDDLGRDAYDALLARARELGVPVVGHVPLAVGVRGALAASQTSIEHLRGYWPGARDDAELAELAQATARSGVWNCVTLVVHDLPWAALRDLAAARERPEVLLVPPQIRARWDPRTDARFQGITEMTPERWREHGERMAELFRIVRALHEAGAPLLLGTDAPNPFVVPGHAVHQELELLVRAGLSPYQALRAGTVNAARCFGELDDSGTVSVGKVADLVLLDGYPLADVGATRRIAGVMLRGRWLDRAELERRLDALVAGYAEPLDWFAGMPGLPSDGDGQVLRYEVTWNDTPIGAERLGRKDRALHTQSVMKDRFDTTRATCVRTATPGRARQRLDVAIDQGGRAGSIRVTCDQGAVRATGTLPSGVPVDWSDGGGDGVYLGAGILPHAIAFAAELGALAVDEQAELELRTPELDAAFEVSTTRVSIARKGDGTRAIGSRRVPVRRYGLVLTTGTSTTRGTLTLDEDGVPATLELVFAQGHKVWRRVE